MTEHEFSTDSNHQRAVLLAWLQTATITTLQARQELDIFHPAARIQELRDLGHKIDTYWTTVDTGKGRHRSACYALLAQV
ncbi:helix-turn-helix domain-containing protein [Methylobacter svalbardensis]|uniref:helix-turn-helix domain-containing protein n=1 Tax=Methylobacter svalbardensis TaxID=3080016 RepID=UPI0030EE677B